MREQISVFKKEKYIKSFVVEEDTLMRHDLEQITKQHTRVGEWLDIIHFYLTNNTFYLRFKYQKESFIDTVKLYEFLLSCDKDNIIIIN